MKYKLTQRRWETWFHLSALAFGGLFFVCTLEGSINIKELPWLTAVASINLAWCIIIGLRPNAK
jgi:hypothetical protein